LLKRNTLSQVAKIKVPTLVVHGSDDISVPVKHSKMVFKELKSAKKLAIIKGAPHTWKKPVDYQRVNPIVLDWFKKYL